MKVTLLGRTKGQIITNFAVAGVGLVLLARWAQQPMASPDEAKHHKLGSLQLPARPTSLDDHYLSPETGDRAQYSLCLSMFKHVIKDLETSAAVEGCL
jgi:hypothetical protein